MYGFGYIDLKLFNTFYLLNNDQWLTMVANIGIFREKLTTKSGFVVYNKSAFSLKKCLGWSNILLLNIVKGSIPYDLTKLKSERSNE